MHAGTITARGRADGVETTVRSVREELLPRLQDTEGCTGLSMLAGRRTGRCVVTTAWRSPEELRAATPLLRAAGTRIGQVLGAVPETGVWEIGLLHRVRPAGLHACCRIVWSTVPDPAGVDDDLATFRMALLPRIEELIGFCSASLLVDRQHGRTALAVTYADREAMAAAGQRADAVRQEYARSMGGRITEVADLDLVIAHLGVPETV